MNSNAMRLIIVTIVLFAVSAVIIPASGSIGLTASVASYISALGFSIACIIKLPRGYRPLVCFVVTLLAAGIPYVLISQGGSYNAAGDGGPNLLPLFVVAGGALYALIFLIWAIASLFMRKSKSNLIEMSAFIKSPAFLSTVLMMGLGIVAVMAKTDYVWITLLLLPIALMPFFVSLFVSAISPGATSQAIIIIGSFFYAVWFGYNILYSFYWHVESYSSIALIYAGILSLPVMIPIWIVSFTRRHQIAPKAKPAHPTAGNVLV